MSHEWAKRVYDDHEELVKKAPALEASGWEIVSMTHYPGQFDLPTRLLVLIKRTLLNDSSMDVKKDGTQQNG